MDTFAWTPCMPIILLFIYVFRLFKSYCKRTHLLPKGAFIDLLNEYANKICDTIYFSYTVVNFSFDFFGNTALACFTRCIVLNWEGYIEYVLPIFIMYSLNSSVYWQVRLCLLSSYIVLWLWQLGIRAANSVCTNSPYIDLKR